MTETIELNDLFGLLQNHTGNRIVVGLAGPPGSGKSMVAQKLESALNLGRPTTAAVLPMDGFHYDDKLLNALGRRARKGAWDTFDVGGFDHILQRLRDNSEDAVAVPVFDRDIEISRGGARLILREISIII